MPALFLLTFVLYVHVVIPGLTILHISYKGFIHLLCIFNLKEEISVLMKCVIFPISASIKGVMMAPN